MTLLTQHAERDLIHQRDAEMQRRRTRTNSSNSVCLSVSLPLAPSTTAHYPARPRLALLLNHLTTKIKERRRRRKEKNERERESSLLLPSCCQWIPFSFIPLVAVASRNTSRSIIATTTNDQQNQLVTNQPSP